MDEFERDHLRLAAAGYAPQDLFFCSGPAEIDEPEFSHCVSEVVEYSADSVAEGMARLPGFAAARTSEYEQSWRWERGDRWVDVSVDADNTDDNGTWLASVVRADCTFDDLVSIWLQVRRTFPAIYLHDQACRMFTPRSFIEEAALPTLAPVMASPDRETAGRAAKAYRRYRKLAGPAYCRRGSWFDRVPHSARSVFDLDYPVGRLRCVNRWLGRDWKHREDEFDQAATGRGLRYFAHPTNWTVGEKYRSGFVAWCPRSDLTTARTIASELDMLAD